MTDPDIPDVGDTDLTREEMEKVAAEYGIDPGGLDDQQLLERLGVALGRIGETEGDEDTGSDDERLRDRAADGLKAAAEWLRETGRDEGGGAGSSRLKLATRAVKRKLPFVGRGR